MGSFNKTGFFSNLPIEYGDKVVVFLLVDTTKHGHQTDPTPISPTDEGYAPIALPFHGKYLDSGEIDDIEQDSNSELLTKVCGKTPKELFLLLSAYGGATPNMMRSSIKKSESEEYQSSYIKEEVENLKYLIDLISKLFKGEGDLWKAFVDKATDPTEKKELEDIYNKTLGKIDNTAITFTMELEEVYDQLVKSGRLKRENSWWKPIPTEIAFDMTKKYISVLETKPSNIFDACLFPHSYDIDTLKPLLSDEEKKIVDKHKDYEIQNLFLGCKMCLHDTFYNSFGEYALYNGMGVEELDLLKGNIVEYADFVCGFLSFCTPFRMSPYHSQNVDYTLIAEVKAKELEIINKKINEVED